MRTSPTQIRHFLTLALIVPALLVLWYPHAARAETITHEELTYLYLALGIIPEAHRAEALEALAATPDTIPLELYVETLVALGIVPEEKAREARAAVEAIQDSKHADEGQDMMHTTPVRTDAHVLRGPFTDRGLFSVTFTVTAHDHTIYIPRDPTVAVRAFILGGRHSELAPSADQQRITLRSNAPRTGNMYRIDKGTTRQFTLRNTFTPTDTGTWTYAYELGYVLFKTESGGIMYEHALPARDAFRTDYVELTVRDRTHTRDALRAYLQERWTNHQLSLHTAGR